MPATNEQRQRWIDAVKAQQQAAPCTSIQKQRNFLVTEALTARPCPACGHQTTQAEAHGYWSDEHGLEPQRIGWMGSDRYRCPHCDCDLILAVPLLGSVCFLINRGTMDVTVSRKGGAR